MSHLAYELITIMLNKELHILRQSLIKLYDYAWVIIIGSRRKSDYPLSLVFIGIWGNLVGPIAWMQSLWQVRRKGQSQLSLTLEPVP